MNYQAEAVYTIDGTTFESTISEEATFEEELVARLFQSLTKEERETILASLRTLTAGR